jgi:hypothetical protein
MPQDPTLGSSRLLLAFPVDPVSLRWAHALVRIASQGCDRMRLAAHQSDCRAEDPAEDRRWCAACLAAAALSDGNRSLGSGSKR